MNARTAKGALTRARGQAEGTLDSLAGQARERWDESRRGLADRIDPGRPVRRRGRSLLAGVLLTAASAIIWTVLAHRPQQVQLRSGRDPWAGPLTPLGGVDVGDPTTSATGASRNGDSRH